MKLFEETSKSMTEAFTTNNTGLTSLESFQRERLITTAGLHIVVYFVGFLSHIHRLCVGLRGFGQMM